MCKDGLGDLKLFNTWKERNMRINKATKSSYGEIARKIIHSVCSVGLTGTQILQEAKDSARFSEFCEKGGIYR